MEQKSSKTAWVVVAAVVIVLLGVGAYAVTSNRSKTGDNNSQTTTPESSSTKKTEQQPATDKDNTSADQGEATTIIFTDKGFSPATYSSKVGQAVKVQNSSSMQLQFSSDNHPAHTDEPELNLSVLAPGESASFTPSKAGTWGFHDHLHDQYTGTLTVSE